MMRALLWALRRPRLAILASRASLSGRERQKRCEFSIMLSPSFNEITRRLPTVCRSLLTLRIEWRAPFCRWRADLGRRLRSSLLAIWETSP